VPGSSSLPLSALPPWYCDWWLGLDAVVRAIGVLAHQNPGITASVMHALADLLVIDIQRTMAVWTYDAHRLFAFKCSSRSI
jgi:hypothetical protein